ncbi:MAG: methyl-accepting chemotaxis protein [Spirochaetales bacterium]|nr:methyl-accepting chemotaxis protein [Spirochaetales bacterium]
MNLIKKSFAKSNYETQLKAPVLQAFLLAGVGLMLILSVLQYAGGFTWVDFFTNTLILGLILVSLIILRKGNYELSSTLFVFTLALLVGVSDIIDGYSGEYVLGQNLLVSTLIILSALFFLNQFRRLTYALSITVTLSFANILIISLTGQFTELTGTLADQLVTPLIMYVLLILFSLLLRRTIDKLIADAMSKLEESVINGKRMRTLALEAQSGLMEAQGMEDQAVESASAIVEIEENIKGIVDKVSHLEGQYESSRNSLNQISHHMDTLENVAVDQSNNITQTSAALEEMVASIANVSQVIDNKMTSVKQLVQSAEEGAGVINRTTLSFKEVLDHLDSVKQMITIISAVASQTNLLAMNAAIEAAHAGEAGRGFAVVADEVRKLAESSAVNAKQVSETIAQLVSSIEAAGNNVENSGTTFSGISTEVRQVGDAMEEISNSVKELAAGNDEILRATTAMNSLTSRVSESVDSVRQQETGTRENIDKLGNFVQNLGSSMGEIRQGTKLIRESSLELQEKSNALNEFVKVFGEKLK